MERRLFITYIDCEPEELACLPFQFKLNLTSTFLSKEIKYFNDAVIIG